MSIFYRIVIILLVLAAGYSLYGIGHFKWMYHRVDHPKAAFQIGGNLESNLTLIEFLNYNCGYCRQLNPVIKEVLSIRKDIRYIARPISFKIFVQEEDQKDSTDSEKPEPKEIEDKITKMVFAAGLQGKFWELHDAVLEHPDTDIPEDFIQETANLYGLDYDRLVKDAESKKVQKIIEENIATFDHVGLYSVPSFMINGKIYSVTDENLPDLKKFLDLIASAEKP